MKSFASIQTESVAWPPRLWSMEIKPDDSSTSVGETASMLHLPPILDSSASNGVLEGVSGSSQEITMLCETPTARELPKEILILILKALPPAAYCRCRCVCKAWKHMLSADPDWTYWMQSETPCSIVTTSEDFDVRILCHSDEKCLSLPLNAKLYSQMSRVVPWRRHVEWRVVDVDEGYFCYHANANERCYLVLCNPMLGAFTVVHPTPSELLNFMVKLLVDRANKTFKVLYMDQELRETALFDSVTSALVTFDGSVPHGANDLFVWKNAVYAYSTKSTNPDFLYGLDMESGIWDWLPVEFPGGKANRHIVADRNQLMLVRSYPGKTSRLEVWKLRDDGSSHERDFTFSMWENLRIGQKISIPGARTSRLVDVCCGRAYICFAFRAGLVEDDVGHDVTEMDICVKYSFRARSSTLIRCTPGYGTVERLFPWEPNLDEYEFDDA